MLEIQTNQLKSRKKVLIDDHPYTVRRLGNIEQLDISQYMRRLDKLAELEKSSPLSETQLEEVEMLTEKVSTIFVNVFDDGGDQSKSRALVASLSGNELSILFSQIFPEAVSNEPQVS